MADGVAGVVVGVAVVREVALIAGIAAQVPLAKMRAHVAEWLECLGDGDGIGIERHVGDARDDRQAARLFDVKIILPTGVEVNGVAVTRRGLAGLHARARGRTLRRGVSVAELHALARQPLEMRHLQHGHFGIGHRLIKGNRRAVPRPVIDKDKDDVRRPLLGLQAKRKDKE